MAVCGSYSHIKYRLRYAVTEDPTSCRQSHYVWETLWGEWPASKSAIAPLLQAKSRLRQHLRSARRPVREQPPMTCVTFLLFRPLRAAHIAARAPEV